MTIDEFWSIVERVHAASNGDMETKCRLLGDELRKFVPEEIHSFGKHSADCFCRLDTWDIWGAAFVINNGCGDDSFMDFRATLISLGRAPFEAALADADSLAAFDIDPAWATYEGYQYVAPRVYTEMRGAEVPRSKTHRKETIGVSFDEWEMSSRFPKLVAKYGYKDSDWMTLKDQAEKASRKQHMVEQTVKVMLEAGIIPSCGLIPSLRIVAGLLRTGRSPESTGRQYTWQPFELDEDYYWSAVVRLEKLPLEARESRPDLNGVELRLDPGISMIVSFDDWLQTLKMRRLL